MSRKRTIGIVSTARADYGLYVPILRALHALPGVDPFLYVTGMHLSPEFGRTVQEIERDGFPIAERLEILLSSDSATGVGISMGLATEAFARAFGRQAPDLLLVLGDRFEMFAAAAAALPFRIPIAHVHGGELSFGAIDESFRHSLTKMSNLHFVSTAAYARRVIQLGEEPWRVTVSGAPGLDNLRFEPPPDPGALAASLGLGFDADPVLVTLHPETAGDAVETVVQTRLLLGALDGLDRPIVFTAANADVGGRAINAELRCWADTHDDAVFVESLGMARYVGMLRIAGAMLGNSSSGIIEAATFGLPVVNIGARQDGRIRARNVIEAAWIPASLRQAIDRALRPEFRASLAGLDNPYGDGRAAPRIAARLAEVPIDAALLTKRFHDLGSTAESLPGERNDEA